MATYTNEIRDSGKMKAIMMSVVALLALAAGAASPQERAKKVNETLSKNIAWFFVRPSYNPGYTKIWPLKALAGKDSELVDYRNRCNCLKAAFIAAVNDLDAPFAACVLVRIRREVKRFSQKDEEALVEKAISSVQFADDYGKSLFEDRLGEEIRQVASPAGYALARMRTIRLAPFILRPPMTLADAVKSLNRKAAAADFVNEGMGVKFVLKVAGFAEDPPELPKVQVGEYEYGNVGVTLEDAVKTIAGSVGYTFKVRSDGVVAVVGGKEYNTK